ncbi:MAG: hypothetical protein JNG88_12625, partial [Phycisphaerales bacterium]|nr:hypothetical protein [Phycisphaerales bacterium]
MLSRLFHRESRTGPFDLARPLLHWSPRDPWTIGMACEGTLICGASGAGKTSGSGKTIAMSMLQNFGGLILTAKAEEIPLWQRYCEAAGRLDDLVLFGPGQPYRFNFLNHELHRSGPGAGYTENVVNVFTTIMELAQHRPTGGGRDSEAYWLLAMRQLIRNAVDLLILAVGWVSIPDLYRLIVSAPPSLAAVASEDWRRGSFCYRHLMLAEKRDKTPGQRQDFELAADYFLQEFPALSDKTRSVIVSTFTSSIDMLNRGVLRELFCTDTNITPEAVQGGRLILMGLPVKEFGAIGLIAQTIWKYMFQRSIEQRDVSVSPRPVFLWADEAQNFITAYDAQFQTTCRSARVATVYLTQNISNVYAALGGESKGKAEAD